MKRSNFPHNKKLLQTCAKERAAYRATLSPAQQLERLDARLGEGLGASQERSRLASALAAVQEAKEAKVVPEKKSPKTKKTSNRYTAASEK